MFNIVTVTAVLIVSTTTATSQNSTPRASILEQLSACKTIQDNNQRLSCYDVAANALEQAEIQGEVLVMDRRQVQEANRQLFGFQFSNPFSARPGATVDPALEAIETTLNSASRSSDGKWVFRLADGSEWRQIDSGEVRFRDQNGTEVRVRRAALGSYLMTLGGSRAVRVRRQ